MPMQLIAPVAESAPDEAEVAWGIEAIGANASQWTGSGVTVAILDSGIDKAHPAFVDVGMTEQDFTGEGDGDSTGHGTHCAATILGRDVDGRRIGVARGVQRLLVAKVLRADGLGDTAWITRGIEWSVREGAQVISMSLGVDFTKFAEQLRREMPGVAATSRALAAYRGTVALFASLADYVRRQTEIASGALLVAAAGNASCRTGNPGYTVDVEPPAAADGVTSVGAVGRTPDGGFRVAGFSNTGPKLAAPGEEIVSAARGGGLISKSGTSMATPHVAGAAALWGQQLLESNGQIDPDQLRNRLLGHSRPVGDLQAADVGSGLVQCP
jgi:subtilisin family serine protease